MYMMEQTSEGVVMKLKVKPGSRRFRLEPAPNGEIVLEVKSPPEKGKANAEVLKRLKAILGHDAEIMQGHRSRNKVVLIRGAEIRDIKDKL